ncbi:DUF6059 family protein [Streptomyces sp. NPDC005209]|uniref:DUF6059 family protein n=1 Tax=Streptomyces sp. NPDC005209 TaxID=3156715 RepID=UPI0033A82948
MGLFRPVLRFVRSLWDGLVVYGLLIVCGETSPYEYAGRRAPWQQPPPGHPERLRADVPLSEFERRLERELIRTQSNPERPEKAA